MRARRLQGLLEKREDLERAEVAFRALFRLNETSVGRPKYPEFSWGFLSHRARAEICDGLDNDCNGETDDADADTDGVNDCTSDRCLGTTPWYATKRLISDHFDSSNMDLTETYGCSCEQILEIKPGRNKGEYKFGCSIGTVEIWINQIGWAMSCSIDNE